MSTQTESIPQADQDEGAPLLEARRLTKSFDVPGPVLKPKRQLTAVNEVSFQIAEGQTLGIVGESGSGKSTLANMIIGLTDPTEGMVVLDGERVDASTKAGARRLQQNVQMVFQDPYSSLNPRMRVADLVAEPLRAQGDKSRLEITARVEKLLDMVSLPPSALAKYPHEFSGGQRQRIVIARALALNPRLLICDEAVSALDVSIQSQVLNLLKTIQRELGLSYLFIGHGLESVYFMSDDVAVMYLGRLVEYAPTEQLYQAPAHPYTAALLGAAGAEGAFSDGTDNVVLKGEIPSPLNPPSGCAFRTRCPLVTDECAEEVPPLTDRGHRQWAACINS